MYQVKEVKAKKKKYLVTLSIDDSEKEFLVSEELLVEFRLVKGKILDDVLFQKFVNAYKKDEIYQKVLHYALFKPRCTHEIIAYLERLKVDEEDYKYHLHKLYKSKILDDEAYVKNYVSEAFEFKLVGPRKIAYDLDNKRIKKELYQPLLDQISEERLMENINNLLEKKIHSLKKQSSRQMNIKIKQYLVDKGYDFELVNRAIDSHRSLIERFADEDSALKRDLQNAKRKYRFEDQKKTEKIYAYLLRKGYSYHKIKAEIGEYEDE